MLKIPLKIQKVIETLCQNGYEAYIVGGCVRDMLLGLTPKDFDITTNALPENIMSLFEKTVPTGIKHGTVTVITDGEPIEVTTFRTEGTYKDHRRPDSVNFVNSLKQDLSRRDFTVNAMAYNENSGLIDYFGGENDLKAKVLRAVGEPAKRFNEDALRILRLFRFSSVLDFTIDNQTLLSATDCANKLKNISSERIMTELYKAINGKNPSALSPLISCGGLKFLGITKNPDYTVLKKLNQTEDLAFFTFLYMSSNDVLNTLQYLKVSNRIKNYCEAILKLLKSPLPQNSAQIKQMLCKADAETLYDLFEFRNALFADNTETCQNLLKQIAKNKEPYLIKHLKIDGDDLKQLGISGEEIGNILLYLQSLVIDCPQMNDKKILIQKVIEKLP